MCADLGEAAALPPSSSSSSLHIPRDDEAMAADATGGRARTARAVAVPARIRARACVFEYRSGDAGLNQSTFCLLMHFCKIWHALQTLFEGFNPKVRARSDPQHFRALFFLRAARRTRRHSGVREGGVARRTARPWRRARAGRGRTDPGREGGACGERRRRRTTHHAPPPRAVRRAQWVAKKRGGRLPRPSPSGGRVLPRASVRRS